MKISNFSILPAMFAPGDEVNLSFTVKAESGDDIGSDGLLLWLEIPGHGEALAWRDPDFSISTGKSKTLAVKAVLTLGAFERGSTVSTFGVQLGIYGSRVDVQFPITLLDAHYKPSISVFTAERSTGSEVNDEGENLLASIRLGLSAAAKIENMSLYLYYRDKANADADPVAVKLTSLVPSALDAEIHTAILEVLGKNSDWNLVLWFGDAYESVASAIELPRSFANVHLSGASTGGVCFGSFSKATEGNPLFQCYYPAEFEEGIKGGFTYQTDEFDTGGKWIDGKRIYRTTVSISVSTTTGTSKAGSVVALSNAESIVGITGAVDRSGSWFPLTMYAGDTNHHRTSCSPASNTVSFTTTHSATAYITVDYTKATEEVS